MTPRGISSTSTSSGYPAALLAILLAAIPPAAAAETPPATPQRPSLSFNAYTVPGGTFEVESGASLDDSGGGIPIFLKYGFTDQFEFEAGFDVVRSVEKAGGHESSQGDLSLGVRYTTRPDNQGAGAGVVGWAKLPTADDDVGSGDLDAGAIGIVSVPIGPLSLDGNLWLSALGRGGDDFIGQFQAIATLGYPIRGRLAGYAEVAWQKTATEGSGGFVDAGVGFSPSPRIVLDAAAGYGWSDGYPDWAVTVGWTVLARSRRSGNP